MKGVKTEKQGWTRYYTPYYKNKDQILPEIKIGQKIQITKLKTRREYTKPPTRYIPTSLIRKMEQQKIDLLLYWQLYRQDVCQNVASYLLIDSQHYEL